MARMPRRLQPLAGLTLSSAMLGYMTTLDLRAVYADRRLDPADVGFSGPVIYLFWHEYIPFMLYLRPFTRCAMLVSHHADAEALSHVARFRGLSVVRGSSRRGGEKALRDLLVQGRAQNLAITPDGPRGPRRSLAVGGVYLASRLGLPVVGVGVGYDRPWRLPTWDRFAIPKPFSRGRGILGPPHRLPADLDRDGLEDARRVFEAELRDLSDRAEDWAVGGYRLADESVVRPTPAARRLTVSTDREFDGSFGL